MGRIKTPEGHSLYWVYIHFKDGGYDLDTSPKLTEARERRRELKREYPDAEVRIFFGNDKGAFTHLDPVV